MEDSTRSVGIETPIILRLLSKRLNPNMFLKEKTYPNIKVRMNCFHEWTGSVASSQSVYRVGADVRILWRLPVWEDPRDSVRLSWQCILLVATVVCTLCTVRNCPSSSFLSWVTSLRGKRYVSETTCDSPCHSFVFKEQKLTWMWFLRSWSMFPYLWTIPLVTVVLSRVNKSDPWEHFSFITCIWSL